MAEQLTDYQLWEMSELAAVAGGSYFNPAADLAKSAREIVVPDLILANAMNFSATGKATRHAAKLFEVLASNLKSDESLFGLYLRGTYLLAPYLPNPESLVTYEAQAQDGILKRRGYYAVPNDIADRGLAESFE